MADANETWIKWSAEYPRPWWRRLLGLPAKRVHIGTHEVEPWPWDSPGRWVPPSGAQVISTQMDPAYVPPSASPKQAVTVPTCTVCRQEPGNDCPHFVAR